MMGSATSQRSTRILLGVIAFLLAANLLVQLNPPSSALAQGRGGGGIPDQGAQLQSQIDQLVKLNEKFDKLQSYLESGTMTVKVKEDKPAK